MEKKYYEHNIQKCIKVTKTLKVSFEEITTDKVVCCNCELKSDTCRQFFSREITNVSECMTSDGRPYHRTKSDLLELFAPKEDITITEIIWFGC